MGKKKKAPVQPTTKTDLGMFGSTTTGPKGSTWNGTDFQKDFTGMTQTGILNAQNALNNRDVAQEAVDNYNRKFNIDFQNNLLTPALNKNWLRGSSANDVASIANQNYQNGRFDLVNSEQQRQLQLLANALAGYGTMYDIAKGSTGLSNSLNQANANYALQQAQLNNQSNSGIGGLMGGLGALVGTAIAPGIGTMIGGQIGGMAGNAASGGSPMPSGGMSPIASAANQYIMG